MSVRDHGVRPGPGSGNGVYVDVSRPSAAMLSNFLLGGGHNFAVDRIVGEKLLQTVPGMKRATQVHRAFTNRAVDFLAGAGIDQFLDLGAGVPGPGATHDRVHAIAPGAAVVYVDVDPVVVAHIKLHIDGDTNIAVVQADLTAPTSVLSDPTVRKLIDPNRPVGVVMAASLHHHIGDVTATVSAYCSAVAAGSYFIISHLTSDLDSDAADAVRQTYAGANFPIVSRTRNDMESLFGALELIDPGLTTPALWRPEPGDDLLDHAAVFLAGVGRKPHVVTHTYGSANGRGEEQCPRATA